MAIGKMFKNFQKIGIVLSGGGAKGCFSLGAIDFFVDEFFGYNPFKFISGTSIGSLNGVKVADGEIDVLKNVWFNIKSPKNVFKKRFFGILGFVLGADSYASLSPLFNILNQKVSLDKIRKSGREYQCAVVNTRTRKLRYISSKDQSLTEDSFRKYLIGSCSIPGIFPPVEINGNYYLDGGIREITPIKPAIKAGCDLIIVIKCSPQELPELQKAPSDIDLLLSVVDTLVNEIYNNDIDKAEFINDFIGDYLVLSEELSLQGFYGNKLLRDSIRNLNLQFQNYKKLNLLIIEPDKEFMRTLDFYPDKIRHGYELGYKIARNTALNSEIFK